MLTVELLIELLIEHKHLVIFYITNTIYVI